MRGRLLLTALLVVGFFSLGRATHFSGGDISYECLGANQFRITLNLYRDCSGAAVSSSQLDITIASASCGQNILINDPPVPVPTEVSQLCPPEFPNSTCSGGPWPGMQKYTVVRVITLPANCNDWVISWRGCNRNTTNNVSGQPCIWIGTTLNNLDFPCGAAGDNDSPVFTANPIPYVCNNVPVTYSYGVFDPNADSLVYSLVTALQNSGSNVTYTGGASGAQPIAGASIHPVTGLLTFTPTSTGKYIFAARVSAYDAAGNLIGTVVRDIQFVVINCTQPPPVPEPVLSVSGDAFWNDTNYIDVCMGDSFCFDVEFNGRSALTLYAPNLTTIFPGATFSTTSLDPSDTSMIGTICWKVQPGNLSPTFVITAEDNQCPIPAMAASAVTLNFVTGFSATPDTLLCDGQSLQLGVSGNSALFTWSTLWGDPINIPVNFSCDSCRRPIANPDTTTLYVVTNQCGALDTILVERSNLNIAAAITDVQCHGTATGSIDLTVTGASEGNYFYTWLGGSNTEDTLGIVPGLYSVIVRDSTYHCQTDSFFTIIQPDTLAPQSAIISSYNGEDISCYGASDGTAVVWAHVDSSGSGPLVIDWTPNPGGGDGTSFVTGLDSGWYVVTITDSLGCVSADSVYLVNPDPVTPNANVITNYNGEDISCHNFRDGIANATMHVDSNGTGVLAYVWTSNSVIGGGAGTNTVVGLDTGWYYVTVTDANGCTGADSTYLTEPDTLVPNAFIGSNYNGRDISCHNVNDGSAYVTMHLDSNGTGPFTYSWTSISTIGAGAATDSVTGLDTGVFVVRVTDANGCFAFASVSLSQPDTLAVKVSLDTLYNGYPISCDRAIDGIALGIIPQDSSGYGQLSYDWTANPPGDGTLRVTNLDTGWMVLTVTDTNNCIARDSVFLFEPDTLETFLTITSNYNGEDISCHGLSDAAILVDTIPTKGGTPPYFYVWAPAPLIAFGQGTDSIYGVPAGTYTVTVYDQNGCGDVKNITVTEPDTLYPVATITSNYNGEDISCDDASDGSAWVTLPTDSNGTGLLSYLWFSGSTFGAGSATDTLTGLDTGYFYVAVTDANGCIAIDSVYLSQPDTMNPTVQITSNYNGLNISCNNLSDGSAYVSMPTNSNGTGALSFLWTSSSAIGGGNLTDSIFGLDTGWFYVRVVDINGCMVEDSIHLTQPDTLAVTVGYDTLYNGIPISCDRRRDGRAFGVVPVDSSGFGALTYDWSGSPAGDGMLAITGIDTGWMVLTVTDLNGCIAQDSLYFFEPDTLETFLTITSNYNGEDVSCHGTWDASIVVDTVISKGGTPPYTYNWVPAPLIANGQGTDSIWGIPAGTYTVTVNDQNICGDVRTITITQPDTILPFASITSNYNGEDISCDDAMDGSAWVTLPADSNGTGVLTYAWTSISTIGGGAATDSIFGLDTGWFVVSVTDINGCVARDSVYLTQPDTLKPYASITSDYNGEEISCDDAMDGSAWVTLPADSNGTGVLSYAWASISTIGAGALTDSIIGLDTGWFVVTVTDVNGCFALDSFYVTQPDTMQPGASITSNYNGEDISCDDAMDGSAYVTLPAGANGTGILSYSWLSISTIGGGAATDSIFGLDTGWFVVSVTDVNGCNAKDSVYLTQPDTLNPIASIISNYNGEHISCDDAVDGSAAVNFDADSNGTGALTYAWISGSTIGGGAATNTIVGLDTGWFVVTVTDVNGCFVLDSVYLTQPDTMMPYASITSNYFGEDISCDDAMDGSAWVTLPNDSNGTGVLSYSWASISSIGAGAATDSVMGLDTGWFVVTITDVNGCFVLDSVYLTQPDTMVANAVVTSNYNGEDISCDDAMDGTARVTLPADSNGTGVIIYSWVSTSRIGDGANTSTLTGLDTGLFVVTVTDVNGCTAMDSVYLTQPDTMKPYASISSNYNGENISCDDAMDGSAWVILPNDSNGTGLLSYSWASISTIGAGALTDSISGLDAGWFVVTVTDVNGCFVLDSVYLTQPDTMRPYASITSNYNGENISCDDAMDGSAWVTLPADSNGTGMLTYSWASISTIGAGALTDSISGLDTGWFVVAVTDVNGCFVLDSVYLTQPDTMKSYASISSNYNGENISCDDAMDGSAWVTLPADSNGTGVLTYSWASISTIGAGALTDSISGLDTGWFVVTITDVNGCFVLDSVYLTQPDTMLPSAFISSNYNGEDISCHNLQDASAYVTMPATNNGTGALTYSWTSASSIGAGAATDSITGLDTGTFVVAITDINGCLARATVLVTQPDTIDVSATISIYAGGYNVSCLGAPDGWIDATVIGGVPGYAYSWLTATGPGINLTTDSLDQDSISAGVYQLTITDANGCVIDTTIRLTQPSNIAFDGVTVSSFVGGSNISCADSTNGWIDIEILGGWAPYTYVWSTVDGCNVNPASQDQSNLCAGSYYVLVIDQNFCIKDTTIILTEPDTLTTAMNMSLYAGGFNITCSDSADGTIDLIPNGGTGPYTYGWTTLDGSGLVPANEDQAGLTEGTYSVMIRDANLCWIADSTTLVDPTPMSQSALAPLQPGGSNVKCHGGSDASIDYEVFGGVAPYVYTWVDGMGSGIVPATQDKIGLGAGTYCVTAWDANLCRVDTCIVITEPDSVLGTSASSAFAGYEISCAGGTNGALSVTPSGGVPPYYYTWTTIGGSGLDPLDGPNQTGLSAGIYSVLIEDTLGCASLLITDTLDDPEILLISNFTGDSSVCLGDSSYLQVVVTGGVMPYYYYWSNIGDTLVSTQYVTPPTTSTFTIYVVDTNGCVTPTETFTVEVTQNIIASISQSQDSICANDSASIWVKVSQGTAPFTYVWSPNASVVDSATVSPENTQLYTVEVMDACGLTQTLTTLMEVIHIDLDFTVPESEGCEPHYVTAFSPQVSSVDPNPTYLWNFGDGSTTYDRNPPHLFKNPGEYDISLTVTDYFGCTETFIAQNFIQVWSNPIANFDFPQELTEIDLNIEITNLTWFEEDYGFYRWDFNGNPSQSTEQYPTITFPGAGLHNVRLSARSIHGCVDTIVKVIDIDPVSTLFVPNTFTPNGDGINDVFKAVDYNYTFVSMQIFDRWGHILYQTGEENQGWNGLFMGHGDMVQDGVYNWKIVAKDANGMPREFAGHVLKVQ